MIHVFAEVEKSISGVVERDEGDILGSKTLDFQQKILDYMRRCST